MQSTSHTSPPEPRVVDRDPLACRVRWHDVCTVETLADGTKRHTADSGTFYAYGPDVPLSMQPLNAPRPITRPEAERIADGEYEHRGAAMMCRRADGEFYSRGDAYSPAAARGWRDEQRRALAARIMRGELPLSLTFDAARDRWYLA